MRTRNWDSKRPYNADPDYQLVFVTRELFKRPDDEPPVYWTYDPKRPWTKGAAKMGLRHVWNDTWLYPHHPPSNPERSTLVLSLERCHILADTLDRAIC